MASASAVAPKRRGRTLKMTIPEWALPLLEPAHYKGIKGGRGGGKSHTVLELQLIAQIRNPHRNLVCIREVQRSLKDSVKRLLEAKIKSLGVESYFDVKSTEIRSSKGDGVILFQGMADHTAVSIKSLEGMDCAVIEEAQVISQRSLDLLRPTIRKPGCELWAIWNPQLATDPIDQFFCSKDRPPGTVLVEVNYDQNPHASDEMIADAEYDKRTDPDKYKHIWLGHYEKHSEARIFKNWRVEAFETPKDAILRFGADWGFSTDPTVLVRGFVEGRKLFIDYEAYEIGCEVEDTKALFLTVPGAEKWAITAGRDRPERIKSAQRQGLKVKAAVSGNNSVIEGVEWLQNYEIIIHPRCLHVADEFDNYKHPIDKLTGQPTALLPSKKNHCIEACRYAVEDVRRFAQGKPLTTVSYAPIPIRHRWAVGGRG